MSALAASVPVAAVGLFVNGVGTGVWDVAMNVEGAAVERGWAERSCRGSTPAGVAASVLGRGVGVLVTALGMPLVGHLGAVAAAVAPAWWRRRGFLPAAPASTGPVRSLARGGSRAPSRSG